MRDVLKRIEVNLYSHKNSFQIKTNKTYTESSYFFHKKLQELNLNASWSRKFLDCPKEARGEMLSPAELDLGERMEKFFPVLKD